MLRKSNETDNADVTLFLFSFAPINKYPMPSFNLILFIIHIQRKMSCMLVTTNLTLGNPQL